MVKWEDVERQREENKENPNYPSVYWTNWDERKLHVKIGDYVNDDLTVEEAIQLFGDNPLFMVEFNFLLQTREETERFDERMDPRRKSVNQLPDGLTMESILLQIEEKIDEIIRELHLEPSDDINVQLKNCCLVQKYIVEHIEYQERIMEDKTMMADENIRILDLYNAAIHHVGVCSSNSILFQEILRRIGMKVECVALESSEGGFHMANLVELGGQYYFFDSTLERSIYEDHMDDGKGLVLCCAALGKSEYCPFYTPKAVMPDNPMDQVRDVPSNIAEERIPAVVVNTVVNSSGDTLV